MDSPTEPQTLEPAFGKRDLPLETRALRDLAVGEFARRNAEYQPLIDQHVAAFDDAITWVISLHRSIADNADFVIGADTRWSASWELSGRVLAQCRVLLHDLSGGYGLESVGTIRSLFEALHLLVAIGFDDVALRKWLAGDDIRPKKARAILARKQALARQRMKAEGIAAEGDVVASGTWLYNWFSEGAHHRRGANTASLSIPRREYAYGPHPDAAVRARETENAGHIIETALIAVAESLADVVGRRDLADVLAEIKSKFDSVRESHPLDSL